MHLNASMNLGSDKVNYNITVSSASQKLGKYTMYLLLMGTKKGKQNDRSSFIT